MPERREANMDFPAPGGRKGVNYGITSRALLLFPGPLHPLNQGFFEELLSPPAVQVEKELERRSRPFRF